MPPAISAAPSTPITSMMTKSMLKSQSQQSMKYAF
jgi:hypothetical protein